MNDWFWLPKAAASVEKRRSISAKVMPLSIALMVFMAAMALLRPPTRCKASSASDFTMRIFWNTFSPGTQVTPVKPI
jgi:hypothetical protein